MTDDQPSTPDEEGPKDPLADLFAQLGIPMPPGGSGIDLSAMMAQISQMMNQFRVPNDSPSGVNWDSTKNAARQVTASLGPDPTPNDSQRRAVSDAARLAELWLDPSTSFGQATATPVAISRAEWVEATMPAWQRLVDPIVSNIARATGTMMGEVSQGDDQLPNLNDLVAPMMRSAIGTMYSMQFAHAVGKLATAVISGSEFGLPLLATPRVSIVSTNAEAFAEGLNESRDDVLLYLTLREAAGQRLFAGVGWLGPQLIALVEHYAREIQIDADAITSAIEGEDLSDLTADKMRDMSQDLTGKMFSPGRTPAQLEILERLETLLALVEGWLDEVTAAAAEQWMPAAPALTEVWRRRRATGGPAEEVFKSLVGLELRPRRVRDAANLWALLTQRRGIAGRDEVWSHPDLMPTARDLDDPLGMVSAESPEQAAPADDWDADLRRLLDEEGGDQEEGGGQ